MTKYTFECTMGHEPMMMEVEAANDDEAMAMMLEKAKAHMAEVQHEGMEGKTDDDLKAMIMNGWQKEEKKDEM